MICNSFNDLLYIPLAEGGATQESKSAEMAEAAPSNVMPVPKIKHDWYQTESHVILTILTKNQKEKDVKVEFTDTTVSVILLL